MERELEASVLVGLADAVDLEVRRGELLRGLLRRHRGRERRHVVDVARLVELVTVRLELVDDEPVPDALERVRIGEERVDVEAPLGVLIDEDVRLVGMRVGDRNGRLCDGDRPLCVEHEGGDAAQIVEPDADSAGRALEAIGQLGLQRVEILHLALGPQAVWLRLEHRHGHGDARRVRAPRLLLEVDDERGGRAVDVGGIERPHERRRELGGATRCAPRDGLGLLGIAGGRSLGSGHGPSIARKAAFT